DRIEGSDPFVPLLLRKRGQPAGVQTLHARPPRESTTTRCFQPALSAAAAWRRNSISCRETGYRLEDKAQGQSPPASTGPGEHLCSGRGASSGAPAPLPISDIL